MNSSPELPVGVLPPEPGDPRYLGPFRLLGRLGAGGMGVVYAGLDDRDRRVAVKCVHRAYAANADFRARFAREVELVRRVRAVGVPAFHDADTGAALPWLATEYVPGPTIGRYARENGPLAGAGLTAFALGVAEVLAAVHAQGVVHRDLKPGNVILAPDGPKVLDFGIARAVDGTALTRTGGLVGTPGWISPEQYRGQDATDRSDVFAWAGLVTYAATGKGPFEEGDPGALMNRVMTEPPALAEVPAHLREVLERALAKEPGERPSADHLRRIVTRSLRDEVETVPGPGTAAPVPSHTRAPGADVTESVAVDRTALTPVASPGRPPGPEEAERWTATAPPRRPWVVRHRRGLAVGAVGASLVLLAAGIFALGSPGSSGALGGAARSGGPDTEGQITEASPDAADPLAGVPEAYRDHYENGRVSVAPEGSGDTPVLLRTLHPEETEPAPLEQLRITFGEPEWSGDYMFVLPVSVEYLPDFGSLRISGTDFSWQPSVVTEEEYLNPDHSATTGVLAELDAADTRADFEVSFLVRSNPVVAYYLPADVKDGTAVPADYGGGICVAVEELGGDDFPGHALLGPHAVSDTTGDSLYGCAPRRA